MRVVICCIQSDAFQVFENAFRDVSNCQVRKTSITQVTDVDCMATTANSFGRMDGGVDGSVNALMTTYEPTLDYFHLRVQALVEDRFCGEQPVGTTLIVPTGHPKVRWVAHMPTMRVPEDVSHTLNAYLAFRSLLTEILWHNKTLDSSNSKYIHSVVCAPCCTSSGSMALEESARQMRAAWDSVFVKRVNVADWNALHASHQQLKNKR